MNVTVYSTASCPYCVMVKRWFDQHDIKYTDKRVDLSREDAQKMVEISGQMGVPFTTIEQKDGNVEKVLGYDVPRLTQIFEKSAA
ncbi:MAG: glutaredoxin 3 [Patescibacteria group bacterium]|nr:glutaredoxin 3 [Patescibacteria group bacterium]